MGLVNFHELMVRFHKNTRGLEWDKNNNLTTRPEWRKLPKLHVYIDESGDRNFADSRQSDYFSMTAVCVAEEHDHDLRFLVGGIKTMFRISGTMHWKEHFRDRPKQVWKREKVVEKLVEFPHYKLIHVLVHKPTVVEGAHMREDISMCYNYASMLLLERVAQLAQRWPGGQRAAITTFGVVGGVDHKKSKEYLENKALGENPYNVPWENILWPIRWRHQEDMLGLQLADVCSGIFDTAYRYGNCEYFPPLANKVYRAYYGKIVGVGIKFFPTPYVYEVYPRQWWRDLLRNLK